MSGKPLLDIIIIDVANTNTAQPESVIVIDLADEEAALKVAKEIAEKTGRSVTVKDENMIEIQTVPAATSH